MIFFISYVTGILDYRVALGRSFRVGWAADGRIAHTSLSSATTTTDVTNAGQVHIKSIYPINAVSVESIIEPLKVLLAHSVPHTSHTSAVGPHPCLSLPLADPSDREGYGRYLRMIKGLLTYYKGRHLQPSYKRGSGEEMSSEWMAMKMVELFEVS